MTTKRYEDPSVLTNQFHLITGSHGLFDLVTIGVIPDETPLASLPTGQRVSTGKTSGYDVDFTLMAGDIEQCTRMGLWREQVKNNVPGYIDSATLVHKNDKGKAALETTITEIFPASFDAPGGSDEGDGEAAKRTGKFSVWETKAFNS